MKVISIPSSGSVGNVVSYLLPFWQCQRAKIVPRNERTPARQQRRGQFGRFASAWSRVLTQAQRDPWNIAGPKVRSKTRLGSGPLSGQQFFQAICMVRACVGADPGIPLTPPAPVVFGLNPIGKLLITNGAEGVRLLLRVSGPVAENIMVFGQAPCSAGRSKRRNVAYLGLMPAPQNGLSDITDLYIARYGEPRVGTKVFIVTCQEKDGWEGFERETNEIVPEKPAEQQASSTGALTLFPHMHKGCTRDAQGSSSQAAPEQQASGEPGAPSGEATVAELGGRDGDSRWPMADSQWGTEAVLSGCVVAGADETPPAGELRARRAGS